MPLAAALALIDQRALVGDHDVAALERAVAAVPRRGRGDGRCVRPGRDRNDVGSGRRDRRLAAQHDFLGRCGVAPDRKRHPHPRRGVRDLRLSAPYAPIGAVLRVGGSRRDGTEACEHGDGEQGFHGTSAGFRAARPRNAAGMWR